MINKLSKTALLVIAVFVGLNFILFSEEASNILITNSNKLGSNIQRENKLIRDDEKSSYDRNQLSIEEINEEIEIQEEGGKGNEYYNVDKSDSEEGNNGESNHDSANDDPENGGKDEHEQDTDSNALNRTETVVKEDNHSDEVEEELLQSLPSMESDREILYLHVGKAAGSTLNKILRANCEWLHSGRQQCFQELLQPESVLSHLTKQSMHTKVNTFESNNVTSFLFSVRNPISRAVSAFNFDHPSNVKTDNEYFIHMRSIFYDKCFPTIEDLATVLAEKSNHKKIEVQNSRDPSVINIVDCFDMAKNTLKGKGHPIQNGHLFANYKIYATKTFTKYPEKEVLIIRTENLWEDVVKLNLALADTLVEHGSTYNATVLNNREETASKLTFKNVTGHSQTHGSEAFTVTSGLSKEGKEIVCCYLTEENQIFEDLVLRATNIDEVEKETYLNQLYSDCGISRWDQKQYRREVQRVDEGLAGFSWVEWSKARGCSS